MLIRMYFFMIRFRPFKWWHAFTKHKSSISTEPKVVDQLRLTIPILKGPKNGWSVIAPHFPFYASKTQPAATLNGVSL